LDCFSYYLTFDKMKIKIKKKEKLELTIWVFLKFLAKWLISWLYPVAMAYTLIYCLIRWKNPSYYFRGMAISYDQLGNVMMQDVFNHTLKKKKSIHRFGDEDETISSVIGLNYVTNNLTVIGKGVRWFLDYVDHDHSRKSIGK